MCIRDRSTTRPISFVGWPRRWCLRHFKGPAGGEFAHVGKGTLQLYGQARKAAGDRPAHHLRQTHGVGQLTTSDGGAQSSGEPGVAQRLLLLRLPPVVREGGIERAAGDADLDAPRDPGLPRAPEERLGVPHGLLEGGVGVVEADPVGVEERGRAAEAPREGGGVVEGVGERLDRRPEGVRLVDVGRDRPHAFAALEEATGDVPAYADTLFVWDLRTDTLVPGQAMGTRSVSRATFTSDGAFVVATAGGLLEVRDAGTLVTRRSLLPRDAGGQPLLPDYVWVSPTSTRMIAVRGVS